jgi:hypothetical protein
MTDHIVDANKMVSPWVTLAERLGYQVHDIQDCGQTIPVVYRCGLVDIGFVYGPDDEYWVELLCDGSKDLLIGRALRVAVQFADDRGDHIEPDDAKKLATILDAIASSADYRATAALELLDAVGYKHD